MKMQLVVILAVGLVVCAACAKAPLKPWDVKTQCVALSNNDRIDARQSGGCEPGATDNICTAFKNVAATKHQSREQCVEECKNAKQNLLKRYILAGCGEPIKRGEQYCLRYCGDNYQ